MRFSGGVGWQRLVGGRARDSRIRRPDFQRSVNGAGHIGSGPCVVPSWRVQPSSSVIGVTASCSAVISGNWPRSPALAVSSGATTVEWPTTPPARCRACKFGCKFGLRRALGRLRWSHELFDAGS